MSNDFSNTVLFDDSESEADDANDELADQGAEMERLDVEFESYTCDESDFHSLKALLRQLFRLAEVDMSGIADLIIQQKHVGCTIKQVTPQIADGEQQTKEETVPTKSDKDKKEEQKTTETTTETNKGSQASDKEGKAKVEAESEVDDGTHDDTVYGVTTMVNLKHHKALGSVKSVVDWLQTKIQATEKEIFDDVLSKNSVGWIINERFANLPVQIAGPIYQTLQEDTQEATKSGEPFSFEYYMILCKSIERTDESEQPTTKAAKRAKKKAKTEKVWDLQYSNAEDELLQMHADHKFTFSVASKSGEGGPRPIRTVMLISANNFAKFIAELQQALANFGT
eukprot:m.112544 g.112544  ORF g.112544 m.112544 type:complete len:340 (-) comp28198_c0_seq6:1188-2207(-)